MANPKFKIGDKVKLHSGRGRANIAYVQSMDDHCGKTAIISDVIISCDARIFYTLKDIPFSWHESLLEAVKCENKIVITTDGTITRAALYDSHKLIKEAKAKCSKDDTFDFETGAQIAFERLTAKPKKDLKLLNTKIFILDGDNLLKSSHIYEIKNGKIAGIGGTYPYSGNFYNMDDVVNYLKPAHIRTETHDSNGIIFSEFNSLKQITVMEVKEG